MKKFFSFVLLICLVFTMQGSNDAYAYTDANNRIYLYYQQDSSKNEWSKLKLGDKKTMGTSGCLIFAYAHAIQWLIGTMVSDTSLLTPMIEEGKYPWKYGIAYYAGKETMKEKGLGKIDGTISIDTLKSIFDNNQVIIANTSYKGNKEGHYVLAVGYTEKDFDNDGKVDFLIQIVDSAVRATYKRFVKETSDNREDKLYARGYNMYDFTTFKKYSSLPSEQCGQYWVKADEFISGMKKARVIIGITDPTKFYMDDTLRIASVTTSAKLYSSASTNSNVEDSVKKGTILYLNTKTVSFNSNGGTGSMEAVANVPGEYTLPECKFVAPAGKQFKGWAIAADGEIITDTYTVANDVTFYAIWEDVAILPEFTIPTTATLVDVNEGETGTMSITSANATAYQWYINRNDGLGYVKIDGATTSTYTTSAVHLGNDGYTYYCVASNVAGSTQSPLFTLNVIAKVVIPETGDNSHIALWGAMMLFCIAGFVVLNRKRQIS